jgi:hypothetical protein
VRDAQGERAAKLTKQLPGKLERSLFGDLGQNRLVYDDPPPSSGDRLGSPWELSKYTTSQESASASPSSSSSPSSSLGTRADEDEHDDDEEKSEALEGGRAST